MKQRNDERGFKDPVCGMEVSHTTAIEAYEHEGKTYYFCASACREAFEKDPEKYIPHHRQHGMK